jgi:PST family polysaccharide transporter
VFSYTAVSTVIKLVASFITMKVIAVMIGPKGLVLLGNLNNFSTIVFLVACGGIMNGVTKYSAEHKDKPEFATYFKTANQVIFFLSLLCTLLLCLGAPFFSRKIFLSNDYEYVFYVLAFTLYFFTANTFFSAILNGLKEFRRYISINIANNVFGLIFTLVLIYFMGLKGVLLSVVTFNSASFVVTWLMIRKEKWLRFSNPFSSVDWKIVKKYLQFSLMSLSTVTFVPLAQVVIRNHIVHSISMEAAGYWDGVNRLSSVYLLVIISTYSPYYLPRLSELKTKQELKNEILIAYRLILPIVFVGFSVILLFKTYVIRLLYAPAFLPMSNLFFYQLAGDFFRTAGWVLAYIMIARAQYKSFILNELIFTISLVILSFLLQERFGLVGYPMAYMFNYMFQFVLLSLWLRNYLKKKML